jgi:RNA polymerase sigma factor (sigma-70 family)
MESMSNRAAGWQASAEGGPCQEGKSQVDGPAARRLNARDKDAHVGRGGTTAAFPTDTLSRQALFSEFTPLVRKLIGQYGDDPDLRQDLVGEIYYRFCKLLDAYEPGREVPLRPYLVRQLIASTYTYARHHWRERQREIRYDELPVWSSTNLKHDPTSEWDDALALRQMSHLLPSALAQLPARQKMVVVWRYFDDMPFEQIAGHLGVQTSTARSLLRHALNNLRRHFAATASQQA